MNELSMSQGAGVQVTRRRKDGNEIGLKGHFIVEHIRGGKVIGEYKFNNGITNQGKNSLLNTYFNGATQIGATKWFLGLINAVSDVLAAGDTYAGINGSNGWDEFTDYTDAGNSNSAVTRPNWNPPDSTAQQVINSSAIVYDITGTGTVSGLFLVGGPTTALTKGDATASGNVLWATAAFTGGDVPVVNLDQLKVTYFTNA